MKNLRTLLGLSLSLVIVSSVPFAQYAFAETKKPAATQAAKVDKKMLAEGKKVFEANCASCHGMTGKGDGPVGKSLKPAPRNFSKDKFKQGDKPEQLFKTISEGLKGTLMPPWKGTLKEQQIKNVVLYVKELQKKK